MDGRPKPTTGRRAHFPKGYSVSTADGAQVSLLKFVNRAQVRNRNSRIESVTTDSTVDRNTAEAIVAWQTS